MFHGYPDVQIAPFDFCVNEEFHIKDEEGCVQSFEQPPVHDVRISFPALTYLGNLAQGTAFHFAVFGRLCGVQLNNTVHVTSVLPAVIMPRPPDDESPEKREKRLLEQQKEESRMSERLAKYLHKEELDSYQVGQFVACSACSSAPYSTRTAQQLVQLALKGHSSVLIVYDPFRTSLMGKLYLRAFVPTAEYLDFYTKINNKRNTLREHRLVRDCSVCKSGVLREVNIEVDVDEYQLLFLAGVNVPRLPSTCSLLWSNLTSRYTTALVESIGHNVDELARVLSNESYYSQKEEGYGPLAQRIDTLLKLMYLREQTQHLESLCDGVLLNTSLLRDM